MDDMKNENNIEKDKQVIEKFLGRKMEDEDLQYFDQRMEDEDFADKVSEDVIKAFNRIELKKQLSGIKKEVDTSRNIKRWRNVGLILAVASSVILGLLFYPKSEKSPEVLFAENFELPSNVFSIRSTENETFKFEKGIRTL